MDYKDDILQQIKAQNLTKKIVAHNAQITQAAMSNITKLDTDVKASTLQKVAEAMGCELRIIHK